jgi:hypothetical protein
MAALSVFTTARHARLRMRRREHLQLVVTLVRAVAELEHSVCIVFTTAQRAPSQDAASRTPATPCGLLQLSLV